jgi:hypothetical protein
MLDFPNGKFVRGAKRRHAIDRLEAPAKSWSLSCCSSQFPIKAIANGSRRFGTPYGSITVLPFELTGERILRAPDRL